MTEINGTNRVRFGAYEADLHTHELWKHGTKVKLIGQPFEILAVLVSRPGQLVTREELRTLLWPGDTFVDFNHGLNAAVNKLRDALCDSAEDPKYIETLPRRGYRFVAQVETVAPAVETVPAAVVERSAPQSEPDPVGAASVPPTQEVTRPTSSVQGTIAEPPKRKRRWLWRLVLASVLGMVVLWLLVNIGILDIIRAVHGQKEKRAAESAGRRTLLSLTSLSDPTTQPAFSPDGSRVAFRRESFVPGMAGLYVKQVGGEDLKQLTRNEHDCCPTWSPDGKRVAFSRSSDKERTIFEVPVDGGEERRLLSSAGEADHAELDWSPDGESIAFTGRGAEGRSVISVLSLKSLTARPVSMPAAGANDWGPAFSPDGQRMAFVRSGGDGALENIVVMPSGGGEVRVLMAQAGHLEGPPVWSSDGQSIVFAGTHENATGLFRIPSAGGVPTPIPQANGRTSHPAVSRRGFRLAFQQINEGRSIAQLDLTVPGQRQQSLVRAASSENSAPQYSPDKKKIVFVSNRAGASDLWVSDPDGQNPVQLTATGTAGTPRWSPDGKSIVFDVGLAQDWRQPRAVFVVSADGGAVRPLVQDNHNNPAPNWSRDGQWVYFPSDRSGSWQLWKVPATGGEPVQITQQGGFAAWEGPDHYLYYAKNRDEGPDIWRIPVGGGDEVPVYPPVRPTDWAAWTVTDKGIMFVESGPGSLYTLSFLDFATLRTSHFAALEKPSFWLGATADGKTAIFDQAGKSESNIMVLENFR